MALDRQTQQSLFEAVNQVALSQVETKEELTEDVEVEEPTKSDLDAIAEAFISGAFGDDLTESLTDEERDQKLVQIVESINTVCYAVNEYFGLNDA